MTKTSTGVACRCGGPLTENKNAIWCEHCDEPCELRKHNTPCRQCDSLDAYWKAQE